MGTIKRRSLRPEWSTLTRSILLKWQRNACKLVSNLQVGFRMFHVIGQVFLKDVNASIIYNSTVVNSVAWHEYRKVLIPGKVTKADLVRILKRVKELMSPVPPVEPLKTRLTKLIFKIVEKNSNEEDVLFWASFILLHVSWPDLTRRGGSSIFSKNISHDSSVLWIPYIDCERFALLQCQIIGNNLTTIFKMVFKASRSQAFSEIIQKSEYLGEGRFSFLAI